MFLSDNTIKELNSTLLNPYYEENVQPCSIDLTLDSIELSYFEIPSARFCLGSTVETVSLLPHIGARVEGKSSWGRLGLFIAPAWIDPGFKGQITLAFYNASQRPIKVEKYCKICQLSFFFLDRPAQNPYDGKYQNQVGIQKAK